MSRCRLEDVNGEAADEYAQELWRAFKNSGATYHYDSWADVRHDQKNGWRAEARRAIADGACPEGWVWEAVGFDCWLRPTEWRLVREIAVDFAKPPRPTTRELLDKAISTRAAYNALYMGGQSSAEYNTYCAADNALLARLVSEIEELRK